MSVGCGLPLLNQGFEWSLSTSLRLDSSEMFAFDVPLRFHLKIEQFRLRVSSYLGSHVRERGETTSPVNRLTIYHLLNSNLAELEREAKDATGTFPLPRFATCSSPLTTYLAFTSWRLAAARLHLHAFYLLDDASMDGYPDRIVALYLTAYSLIEVSLSFDDTDLGFFHHCPFSYYQVFTGAAFVLLRVLSNGYFRTILDVEAGTQVLEAAIGALRKISVVNNDLPARLGDVIGYFCAAPDPKVVGGATIDDLRLTQVRSRMSVSVVYDCLRTWRSHFLMQHGESGGTHHYNTRDK